MKLVKYSDKSFALFGEDTKEVKSELSALGGRFNRFLTDPSTKKKTPGWIFSNKHKAEVTAVVKPYLSTRKKRTTSKAK